MRTPSNRYLQMVKCRAYGHAWEDRGWLPMIKRGRRVWDQLLTCPRCEAQRHDQRSHGTLTLENRYYDLWTDYPGTLSQHDALAILMDHDATEEADTA